MRFSHGFGMTTGRLHVAAVTTSRLFCRARRIGPPYKLRTMHKLTRMDKYGQMGREPGVLLARQGLGVPPVRPGVDLLCRPRRETLPAPYE